MVLTAFNAIPLTGRYTKSTVGAICPRIPFLRIHCNGTIKISSEHRDKRVESFKQSGRAAGILKDEGGKIRVLQMPTSSSNGGPQMPSPKSLIHLPPTIRPISCRRHLALHRRLHSYLVDSFPVILDGARSVTVPLEFDRDDLDYLNARRRCTRPSSSHREKSADRRRTSPPQTRAADRLC